MDKAGRPCLNEHKQCEMEEGAVGGKDNGRGGLVLIETALSCLL